jgi:hypothetical protein
MSAARREWIDRADVQFEDPWVERAYGASDWQRWILFEHI